MVISEEPWQSDLMPSVWQWSCQDLCLSRLRFEHLTFRLWDERSYSLCHRRVRRNRWKIRNNKVIILMNVLFDWKCKFVEDEYTWGRVTSISFMSSEMSVFCVRIWHYKLWKYQEVTGVTCVLFHLYAPAARKKYNKMYYTNRYYLLFPWKSPYKDS